MSHTFVSYFREDRAVVDQLVDELRRQNISVWLDREQILPGQRWQNAIRQAIKEGSYFIVCFSKTYSQKDRSYIHEELTLAIEELRKRPVNRAWFIPVLLEECEIPDRSIGAGETLQDIQWVDLSRDWESGIEQVVSAITQKEQFATVVKERINLRSRRKFRSAIAFIAKKHLLYIFAIVLLFIAFSLWLIDIFPLISKEPKQPYSSTPVDLPSEDLGYRTQFKVSPLINASHKGFKAIPVWPLPEKHQIEKCILLSYDC